MKYRILKKSTNNEHTAFKYYVQYQANWGWRFATRNAGISKKGKGELLKENIEFNTIDEADAYIKQLMNENIGTNDYEVVKEYDLTLFNSQ